MWIVLQGAGSAITTRPLRRPLPPPQRCAPRPPGTAPPPPPPPRCVGSCDSRCCQSVGPGRRAAAFPPPQNRQLGRPCTQALAGRPVRAARAGLCACSVTCNCSADQVPRVYVCESPPPVARLSCTAGGACQHRCCAGRACSRALPHTSLTFSVYHKQSCTCRQIQCRMQRRRCRPGGAVRALHLPPPPLIAARRCV